MVHVRKRTTRTETTTMADFTSFLLGENPADIELNEPGLDQTRATRELIRKRKEAQLIDGQPGPGEQAIYDAAARDVEQFAGTARGGAAGARGVGRVAAQSQAQRIIGQGTQDILGKSRVQGAAQSAADEEAAIRTLMGVGGQEVDQLMLERQLREKKAKPGHLGSLLGLAGAGIGFAAGGPAGAIKGGKLGASAGGGIQQHYRPRG